MSTPGRGVIHLVNYYPISLTLLGGSISYAFQPTDYGRSLCDLWGKSIATARLHLLMLRANGSGYCRLWWVLSVVADSVTSYLFIYLFESLTCLLSWLLQRKLIYLGLEQQIAIADSLYGLSTLALPLDWKRHSSDMCSTAYIILTSHSTLKWYS